MQMRGVDAAWTPMQVRACECLSAAVGEMLERRALEAVELRRRR